VYGSIQTKFLIACLLLAACDKVETVQPLREGKPYSNSEALVITVPAEIIRTRELTVSWTIKAEITGVVFNGGMAKDPACDVIVIPFKGIKTKETTLQLTEEGAWYACLEAESPYGKKIAATNNGLLITLDETAPAISLIEDLAAASAVKIAAEVTDTGTVSLEWSQVSGPGTVTFSDADSATTELSADVDGAYVVRLTAVDAVGNTTSKVMNFRWLTAAPIAAASGLPAEISSETTLTAKIAGEKVASYQVKFGEKALTDCATPSGYSEAKPASDSLELDVSKLPDGDIVVCVLGVNEAEVVQPLDAATKISWVKDTTAPQPPVFNDQVVHTNATELAVSWTKSTSADAISHFLFQCASTTCTGTCSDAVATTGAFTLKNLTNDTSAYLCGFAQDSAGLKSPVAVSGKIAPDFVAPSGHVLSSPFAYANAANPTVSWSDATGEAGYSLYVHDGALTCNSSADSGVYSLAADVTSKQLSGLVSGKTYHVCLVATDLAGNATSVSSAFFVDTAAPVVNAGSDISTTTAVSLAGSATDISSLTYEWSKVSGPGTVNFADSSSLTSSVSADTDGAYVLRLTATDAAGNSASDDLAFTWVVNLTSAPVIQDLSHYKVGWGGAGQDTITLTLDTYNLPSGLSGTVKYYCNYGRVYDDTGVAVFNNGATFVACDGSSGNSPTVTITSPGGSAADGTWRVQVRAELGAKQSPVAAKDFYAHRSLNGVASCTQAKTDNELFDLAAAIPYLASAQAFGAGTNLIGPVVTIEWASGPNSKVLTLRKEFVRKTVGGIDLMLLRRSYTAQNSGSGCFTKLVNSVVFPSGGAPAHSQSSVNQSYALKCSAIAFNAEGRGYCLEPDNIGALPYEQIRNTKNMRKKFEDSYNTGVAGTGRMTSPKELNMGVNGFVANCGDCGDLPAGVVEISLKP